MNYLEITGLIALIYLSISALVSIIIMGMAIHCSKESVFTMSYWWLKLPLILFCLILSWPLMLIQLAEISFDETSTGYPT